MTTLRIDRADETSSFGGYAGGTRLVAASTEGERVFLFDLATADYELTRPLALDVEEDEARMVIVSEASLGVYGVGETLQDAVRDFESMLIDSYRSLGEAEGELAWRLSEILDRLRLYVSER